MLKHSAGVNIIDATSKQLRRQKESSPDNINDTGLARRGIAAINNKEKSTKLYLIDNEGKKVWKFELSSPAVIARQRCNATKATKDAIFILTKFEDNGIISW